MNKKNKVIELYDEKLANLINDFHLNGFTILKKKVTIISGDTGASKDLPSYFCKKNRNITVLVNGIGNLKKDNILILKKENIYRYEI